MLANELGAMHNCKTRIIPYVLTWDGIVTKFHKSYSKEIGLTDSIQSYIQFIVLKKTMESISFSYRRDGEETTHENQEREAKEREKESSNPSVVVNVCKETLE